MLSLNRDTRNEYRCSGDLFSSYLNQLTRSSKKSCTAGGALCSLCHVGEVYAAQANGGNCE